MRLLTGERLKRERQKWNSIKWLIIYENSMVPYTTLRNIHLWLQQMKVSDAYFGGINVLSQICRRGILLQKTATFKC